MNSYQALSSATVMLNLNRAEKVSPLSAGDKSDNPSFKRVLAAESASNQNNVAEKKQPKPRQADESELKNKSDATGSAQKRDGADQNSDETAATRQQTQPKKTEEKPVESEIARNKDSAAATTGEPEASAIEVKEALDPPAPIEISTTPGAEPNSEAAEMLDLAQLPGQTQTQPQPQPQGVNAPDIDPHKPDLNPINDEFVVGLGDTLESTEKIDDPEASALMALFNWIATNVKPDGVDKGDVNPALPEAKPAMSQPLARAISELNALNSQASLASAADPAGLTERATAIGLTAEGNEPIKAQPPISLAQLSSQVGLPVSTVATTLDSLMKTVKNQLEAGSQREPSSLAPTSSAATSAFGRSLEALRTGSANGVFTLPDQAKGAVGQPQWHTAIAERVAIMASQRITSAEIQLDPPELGQLQVRVSVNQEQTHVSFVSQHAVVREALDQTAFRLREMFTAEGLNLVDVDVSGESFQQQREAQRQQRGDDYSGPQGEEPESQLQVVELSSNLVDHFV